MMTTAPTSQMILFMIPLLDLNGFGRSRSEPSIANFTPLCAVCASLDTASVRCPTLLRGRAAAMTLTMCDGVADLAARLDPRSRVRSAVFAVEARMEAEPLHDR